MSGELLRRADGLARRLMDADAETDPHGTDAHAPGAKLDAGKIEPELIQRGFARALDAVAQVGTYGANKYTRDGWEAVPEALRRYTNALYRHMNKHHRGELCDPDTGLSHLAHAAWNSLAILELTLRQQEARADRPESITSTAQGGPSQ